MHNPNFERGLLRAFAQQGLTPDRAEALIAKQAEKRAGPTWFIDAAAPLNVAKNIGVAGLVGLLAPPAVALGGGYAAGRMAASGYDAIADQFIPKPKKDVDDFKADELARQMMNRMDRLKRKVKPPVV